MPPSDTNALPTLWLATRNTKKGVELARVLAGLFDRAIAAIRTIGELDGGDDFEIVEDAPDFAGNARKKASLSAAFCRARGVPHGDLVLADDSGLCVEHLDGAPGVLSARYAGPDADDAARNAKLLSALTGVPGPERGAWFACALALFDVDEGNAWEHEAHCHGRILEVSCGEGGFGYDPVFTPAPDELEAAGLTDVTLQHAEESRTKSFAELGAAVKDRISHRGKALARLREHLENRAHWAHETQE